MEEVDQQVLFQKFIQDDSSRHSSSKHIGRHDRKHGNSEDKPYTKSRKINKNLRIATSVNSPTNTDQYEDVKLPTKGRPYTVSIAVPASILEDTCLKDDLRTYVAGQLARSATIFGVDEIVVYNDHCWKKCATNSDQQLELMDLMSVVLQYQECPQYLRKKLCPLTKLLSCAGILNVAAAPHHLKGNQWCPYREGVVVGRCGKSGSLVDVGLGRDVTVPDKTVEEGARVTVKLPPASRVLNSPYGTLVSPHEPREELGLYWGYTVRVADTLAQVLSESEHTDGYDLLLGTSDKGTPVEEFSLTEPFKHAIIVFGGVDGLEVSLGRDQALTATSPDQLFDAYLNTCKDQHARTIRTEEAVPLSLAALMPILRKPFA